METKLLIKLTKKLFYKFGFLLVAFNGFYFTNSFAASCCGGSAAIPSLIINDDKIILNATFTQSTNDTEVLANGIWKKITREDITQVFKLNYAHIFHENFQYGVSIPLQSKHNSENTNAESRGLGDITVQLGYEFLNDWDYNIWKPRGLSFISLTAPTGKSIYDSGNALGYDTTGRGFWVFTAGAVFSKVWNFWDANSTFEVHKSFEKNVNNETYNGSIMPGYGGSLTLGVGYNIKDFRIGSSIAWANEDPIKYNDSVLNQTTAGSRQRYATGSLQLSYMFNEDWSGSVGYADQTLFGEPINTSLSKSVMFFVQKRWLR